MMLNNRSRGTQNTISVSKRSERLGAIKGATSIVVGAIVLLSLAGSPALGELVIQPMQMQIAERPNKKFTAPMTIENLSHLNNEEVSLRIVDLVQDPNGMWEWLEPDDPRVKTLEASCASWLKLKTNMDHLRLEPNQQKAIMLEGLIPPGRRGYFAAGILATTEPRPGVVQGYNTNMVFEYLIPIVIQVQGRTVRDEISLVDAGLQFMPQTSMRNPATCVTMTVKNTGVTYASLNAMGLVWAKQGGHWRKISETEFPGRSILPGTTFVVRQDVGRPLTAGAYKVQVFLYVNGRRTDYHEVEVQFGGDSRVAFNQDDQKGDAVLILDPPVIELEAVPGSMRQDRIAVSNFSEESVDVEVEVVTPDILLARTLSLPDGTTLLGSDLGCSSWLKVDPEKFTIRGYGRQNIRIIADMPESAGSRPHYYAALKMHSTYPDGQLAGTNLGYAIVTTRGATETPMIDGKEFTVTELGPTRYLAVSRFVNLGDTHVMPVKCSGMLMLDSNSSFRRHFVMAAMQARLGYMLPLSSRQFTGTLDISDIEPGVYRVAAVLELDKGRFVNNQQAIRIKDENGTKTVEVIGLDAIGGAVDVSL